MACLRGLLFAVRSPAMANDVTRAVSNSQHEPTRCWSLQRTESFRNLRIACRPRSCAMRDIAREKMIEALASWERVLAEAAQRNRKGLPDILKNGLADLFAAAKKIEV